MGYEIRTIGTLIPGASTDNGSPCENIILQGKPYIRCPGRILLEEQ
ncbi:hypothetical protein [Anaerophaga thermohalophila]|nr:hypothetical protein [Anaerophaga thermohalophila]